VASGRLAQHEVALAEDEDQRSEIELVVLLHSSANRAKQKC
jgi:hypothetical protein